MKKMFMYAVAAMLVLAPVFVDAADDTASTGSTGWGNSGGTTLNSIGTGSGMTDTSFATILGNISAWLVGILGIGAILSFVIAGILYLTAAGDETKTEKAKSIMTYAIIAVVVALIGYIAINLVGTLIKGGSTSDL